MPTTAPRYEAQDKTLNNLKYRLFRHFDREWGTPITPPPGGGGGIGDDDFGIGTHVIGEE